MVTIYFELPNRQFDIHLETIDKGPMEKRKPGPEALLVCKTRSAKEATRVFSLLKDIDSIVAFELRLKI